MLVPQVLAALRDAPLAYISGPPRSGKSTLAAQLAARLGSGVTLHDARIVDVRSVASAALAGGAARTLILDNADEAAVRDLADTLKRNRPEASAEKSPRARFVALGACSHWPAVPDGPGSPTVSNFSLRPFSLFELGAGSWRKHWFRGGYPEACAAASDAAAMEFLKKLAADLAERLASAKRDGLSCRDILAVMTGLAERQGQTVNESELAARLGASRPTVARAVKKLVDCGIARALPPYIGKRCRSSATYILCDQGMAHALLSFSSPEELMAHGAQASASWKAYVLEQVALALPPGRELSCYATREGATLDCVVAENGEALLAACARRHAGPPTPRGAGNAAERLGIKQRYIVSPEGKGQRATRGFTELGIARFLETLSQGR